ncbi:MAG: undecaprenyl/decaprenyl-phosphate alpha-N-acetylglucosaminyl 1-phosphate transferase, partial [Chloroflexi bacterium]|nr:undecaprenyl/decaprenyl-phosphate alpha-N-acetylglucosaminyl 1-phosphate transferase [Chloroflexota bacterium]
KIFLGDSGSLIVGLFIAVATIRTTYYHQGKSGHWFNTLMPLIILAVPLYDFISVVIIRWLAGESLLVGDNRHFSHRLVKRGMTHRQAVLTIYLTTACCGLGATFLYQLSPAGAFLVFGQTIMILLIIAILEKPTQTNSDD